MLCADSKSADGLDAVRATGTISSRDRRTADVNKVPSHRLAIHILRPQRPPTSRKKIAYVADGPDTVFVSCTRLPDFDAFVVLPKNGSMIRRLASLHWLQTG